MKKTILLAITGVLCLFFSESFGQVATQGFNYQGVYRDNNGAIQKNTSVSVNFIIYKGSVSSSNIAYSESQTATTDNFGVFNMVVGNGTPSGSTKFSDIDWTAASQVYYLKVQVVISGTPTDIGTTQLVSVPYAQVAGTIAVNPFENYIIMEERKSAGTNGGANVTGWQRRKLNTTVDKSGSANGITFDSVNSQFTLAPGKYYVDGYTTMAGNNTRVTCMIFNSSDTKPAVLGSSGQTTNATTGSTGAYSYTMTWVQGFITVSGSSSKTFDFQMYADVATNYVGLGASDNATSYSGASTYKPEVYTHLLVQRVK